ncbi:ribonuclease HII [Actinomyces vulturis]|uniref:ribonuclease HII n=1 Tax=Actinomyces vulturis TaxID=1857645 RepID=UPI00082ADF17|nr:ribonuclease HII [Actinomyces vulturis]
MATKYTVTRDLETELLRSAPLVGGMDEVGRGCIAGPVTIGLAVVSSSTNDVFPEGLADSKALRPTARERMCQPIDEWAECCVTASASAKEIDAIGIIDAMRLAGRRALHQAKVLGALPNLIILDGSHNWLTPPELDLLAAVDERPVDGIDTDLGTPIGLEEIPPVTMRVKADATCAVVAAASVVAKVRRDAYMSSLDDPGYQWASNKGYASQAHQKGLATLGVSAQHRTSWSLPGLRLSRG